MIRKATQKDLQAIMNIVKDTLSEMHSYNNYQWDENYPNIESFSQDVEQGSLFVAEQDSNVTGFICIDKNEPAEYAPLDWSLKQEAYVLHRLAIHIDHRKEGVASQLFNFAEEYAIKNGTPYIKTDTYCLNVKAQGLIKKYGFKFVGEMNFKSKPLSFYCYDKVLQE